VASSPSASKPPLAFVRYLQDCIASVHARSLPSGAQGALSVAQRTSF